MRDERHIDKFLYTRVEGVFYEPFEEIYKPSTELMKISESLLEAKKDNWTMRRSGLWVYIEPKDVALLIQGWKIHVSATQENVARILQKVAEVLIEKEVHFKFTLDKTIFFMMNYKNWPRGGSGKFITIYPRNIREFKGLLEKLYENLRFEEGSHILSDKRYKEAKVLYYRYGGIKRNTTITILGTKTPILITPSGESVPDERLPYFNPPYWAEDPFPNVEDEPDTIILHNGRYLIKSALSFSNTGGVYLAEDRESGKDVVIKEARPHTCIDGLGYDAISLLRKEFAILKLLEVVSVAPKPIELFQEWEHLFLVEEYIEGANLREILLEENPLSKVAPLQEDTEFYYSTFKQIFINFAETLKKIHERGIVLGDLSVQNFIIDPQNYNVIFIDFDAAFRLGIDEPTYLHTAGFSNVTNVYKRTQSFKDDLYTMGIIMFYALFPINAFSTLRKDIYNIVLKILLEDLGWPSKVFDVINRLVEGQADHDYVVSALICPPKFRKIEFKENIKEEGELKNVIDQLGKFILNHMEVNRTDRLFPADPFVFETNPLSLGFGASGVMYALKKCDFRIPKKAYKWLERELYKVNEQDYAPGLLTGTSGIAWVIWELGYEDKAFDIMEITNKHSLCTKSHSLFYGASGIGMANLYLYYQSQQTRYLDKAVTLGEMLLNSAKQDNRGIYWEDNGKTHIGYGYGQTGVALFLLRLSQFTGYENFLLCGKKALEFDLSYSIESKDGVLTFPTSTTDSETVEPYLEVGSAGIIKVLLRYGLLEKVEDVIGDVYRKYSVFSGLLFGLASFVDAFTDTYLFSQNDKYLRMANRPLTGIYELYMLKTPQGFATPGDSLFRISCDYATGSAGVMRTLHRYLTLEQADFTLDGVI